MNPFDTALSQLQTIPLFDGLPAAQYAQLSLSSSEKHYRRDQFVFLKGDRPTHLFAILEGTIKLACQSPQGEEKIIDLLGPGQVFGESALLLDTPYPYLTAAVTDARLLLVEGAALRRSLQSSPILTHRLLTQIAQGICTVMRDLEDIRTRSPRERVVRFLLDQRRPPATVAQSVPIPVPKHAFASLLGMTPESLSRNMRDLADAGLIEVGKRGIEVLDPQRLACFAG